MPHGPGKYDAECTRLQEELKAHGVLLVVVGGDRGNGFSVSATLPVVAALPKLLRQVADEIDASFAKA